MGQVLDKPVIEKKYDSGNGNGLKFAAAGMQGWRLDMEDAHSAIPEMKELFNNTSYYAVFDGHAGSFTSEICSEKLHEQILDTLKENGFNNIPDNMNEDEKNKLSKALADAFVKFDYTLKNSEPYTSGKEGCGTTALACLITSKYIIFCNCGDSRGFLSRKGEVYFQTKDHKPGDIIEKKRIEESGGTVIMDRVNGNLAVSRAIGDFSFKDKEDLDLRDQAVSPEPTITIIERKEQDEEFIILACDGIWDVMTCEKVRNFINNRLLVTDNLLEIMSDLINACLILDSRDNMTCMIILFPDSPKIIQLELDNYIIYIQEIKKYLKEYIEKNNQNISVISAYEYLCSQNFIECTSSLLGPISNITLIEKYLDELDSNRNKDKDYSQSQVMNSFPVSLQAIQQLVRREPVVVTLPESSNQDQLSEDIEDVSDSNS